MIDSRHFRDLAGHFATGVAVVTAIDPAGSPAGMTVNSFTSLSLEPPLVSVAIARYASAWQALSTAERWTVNLLGTDQEVIARRFAGAAAGRFDGTRWSTDDGWLILHDTIAHLCCITWQRLDVGDHLLLIGEVVAGSFGGAGAPLMYYRGGYRA